MSFPMNRSITSLGSAISHHIPHRMLIPVGMQNQSAPCFIAHVPKAGSASRRRRHRP